MTGSSPPDASTDGYIRGGGATVSISRFAVRIMVVAVLLALAGLTIAYAVTAHNETSRRDRLHAHGVPVAVTVTTCRGEATGTGIIESQFFCRGTFVLNGRRYTDAITDSSTNFEQGAVIAGVTDSQDPSLLSTATAVAHEASAKAAYSGVVVCGGGFLLVLIIALWWPHRGSRRGATADAEDAEVADEVSAPGGDAPAEVVAPSISDLPAPAAATTLPTSDEQPATAETGKTVAAARPADIPAVPAFADAGPAAVAAASSSAASYRRLAVPAAGLLVTLAVVTLLVRRRRSR